MVVVSHLSLFLGDKLRGRCDSCESHLPLFKTIYFPIAPFCVGYPDIMTAPADARKIHRRTRFRTSCVRKPIRSPVITPETRRTGA